MTARLRGCPCGCPPDAHEPPCTVGTPIKWAADLYDLAALDAAQLAPAAEGGTP